MKRKIAIIGIDCASAKLVFKKWINHLPNLQERIKTGVNVSSQSCDPPIRIPVWAAMIDGKDPYQLSVCSSENRIDYS